MAYEGEGKEYYSYRGGGWVARGCDGRECDSLGGGVCGAEGDE